MSADRFVTAVLTTCALWLTESLWFEVYLLPNIQVLLKLASLVKAFWSKENSLPVWLQGTSKHLICQQSFSHQSLLKSDIITWIWNQITYFPSQIPLLSVKQHGPFLYNALKSCLLLACVSIGDISSWYWHRNCSRLLRCWESQQLLSEH